MMIAQKLYEAGHITYMRTDSLNLSSLAIASISNLIKEEMGEGYLKVRKYHTSSKGAQEAHEAIRPTYMDKETVEGTAQEKKLYRLIRLRTIASQMADAEMEKTTVEIGISNRQEHFSATGEVIKFDGFLRIYLEGSDDDTESNAPETTLPRMTTGEGLTLQDANATERFTLAPPRYTESSLVKKMEELGIGRPSTYAPTILDHPEPRIYRQGREGRRETRIYRASLSRPRRSRPGPRAKTPEPTRASSYPPTPVSSSTNFLPNTSPTSSTMTSRPEWRRSLTA